MRVVVAPDGFKGTLSAPEVAEAIGRGWSRARPHDVVALVPMSDGGPGFLDVLASSLEGEIIEAPARDPFGRPRPARFFLSGETGYLESAECCGFELVAPPQRNPLNLSSTGLADLLLAAAFTGARRVVVGLGGTVTNDGGAGMLHALGLRLFDVEGRELVPEPRFLERLHHAAFARDRLHLDVIVAASDVNNPLLGPHGASATYGPQKGASPGDVAALERALSRFAEVIGRDVPGAEGLEDRPGAGAAGGLGYGLLVLGATGAGGFELVSDAVGLGRLGARADVFVTGEGSFDEQSLRGKVVIGVAGLAKKLGRRCLVLAGQVRLGEGEAALAGVTASHSLVEVAGSLEEAGAHPREHLERLAERVARHL